MYTLRRWWERYSLQTVLVALSLAGAWAIRAPQGPVLLDAYYWLSYPFQSSISDADIRLDASSQELQQRLQELEAQNRQLQGLLDYVDSVDQVSVSAPIIGRSADQWWQQVTLGRGASDGIVEGSVAVGLGGIVGRVIEVSSHTSRVLLVSDPSSQVGVAVSRSRAMGYLRGQSGKQAVMVFFDKVPDVKPGDTIVTSRLSHLYPAGYPVGRVEAINLDSSPAPEAVVSIGAPIEVLEWVTVYIDQQPSQTLDE